jgi:UDPglucose 6-dehydrogenase
MTRICVHRLSHLGTVTAACLTSAGHAIIGRDDHSSAASTLERREPLLCESGLADLIRAGATAARLKQVSP